METLKCVIFRDFKKDNSVKILNFSDRKIAEIYYNICLRKTNFLHADILEECIKWCEKNKYKYIVIERD